jgi:hypothetical protein
VTGRCIAMWSGPRNISTAMMRAWENRSDTVVVDEPFYAHFLDHTRIDHPMCETIITHGEVDSLKIIQSLVVKPETGLFYQKHITTHWLDHYPTDWLMDLDHVFLIREPEPVAASYAVKRGDLSASDLGYEQQARLFKLIKQRKGATPPVIDSRRFLNDPQPQLETVCQALNIPFEASMLQWPAGSRLSDGVWGSHWYDAVNMSTGFNPARNKQPTLNEAQQDVASDCRPYYEELLKFAF